ncbi:hypothetical protein T492DRAFT_871742 [Pavlovales sp. CCMP2436]|nr:hypothetical protein T492DRAFT_871742 [Pavlovales sp. CCMP2436]
MEPEEVADARVSLLVRTFGKFVPQIQRALLNYERVLFIGQTPAFIAGVTNPMWDLLCDVDTGKVLRAPVVAEAETAAEVILGSRLVAGVEAQLPEGLVSVYHEAHMPDA